MNANDGSVACVVCARRTKRQASFHQRGCLKNCATGLQLLRLTLRRWKTEAHHARRLFSFCALTPFDVFLCGLFQVPDRFLEVAEITLHEFFNAIYLGKDQDPAWKKAIYKVICKLDSDVPEEFKTSSYL